MKAVWNSSKNTYEIEMTKQELGTVLFALTIAKQNTRMPSSIAAVADLQKEFLNLNSAPVSDEKHIWGECPTEDCSQHPKSTQTLYSENTILDH
jgi:hypothetical protein